MAETVDILKLKLAELKQECLARGLDVKGNKSDLISRLQAYLDEHAEEDANEEDVLGDETEEEEQKPVDVPEKKEEEEEPSAKPGEIETETKVVKITSGVPLADRLQKRAERFNVPANLDSKKAARAIRFGLPSTEQKGQTTGVKSLVNVDKLKVRAQRFGVSVSPVTKKTEDDEKLKKRKERFGIVTNSASISEDSEAKKRKRSERFGLV
ncbi:SAP domain-containing ribonucleoprotein isoform X1 [Aquarana catesbeiana]|uniref:SAP domain-containing ribonucleoprotein n=1 Tax=Aquarana catesbeiana TaxID=8400 RepID=C1C4E3_AQUCT|nr:Nuclear protein Hcc-1 [Aquarana catesbeiana]